MKAMKKEFIEKVIAVQAALKAPKGQYNKFAGYRYRSCEDILEAAKPLLRENGLALFISDEVAQVGDRFYVKATATLTDGEDEASCTAYAREPLDRKGSDASQVTGAASSYARKYAAGGLLCIDDTKDADGGGAGEEELAPALQEIGGAKSVDELRFVYGKYKELQGDGLFMAALSARKKELQ